MGVEIFPSLEWGIQDAQNMWGRDNSEREVSEKICFLKDDIARII